MTVDLSNIRRRIAESMVDEFELVLMEFEREAAAESESPIETMLLLAFKGIGVFRHHGKPSMFYVTKGEEYEAERERGLIVVYPQFKWSGYRIDFMVKCGALEVFIECDGHAFHERTPDQAERDRKKDRAAQAAGIPILRFTGREIYRDPVDVAWQIIRFMFGRVKNRGAE